MEIVLNIQANVLHACQETSLNSVVLNHAQSELTVKTRFVNIVLSNVLLVWVLPTLVLLALKDNFCLKENVMLNAQFHWLTVNVQTHAQLDISLNHQTETVLNAVINVNHVKVLLINVLPALQVLLQTVFVFLHAQPTL